MTKRITIREVAKQAGVGTMTVSRVVNNSGYVHKETRLRVEEAIASLGYMPNHHAKSLRSRKSGTIALLVTDITNPFFTTVARGVEDAASASGHLVLLGNTDELEAEELRYMRMLIQKGVDGVLFVPHRSGAASLDLARRNGIPVIVIDRRSSLPDTNVVRCDSAAGAALLASLLLEKGHSTYAILAGPSGISTSDDRVMAFKRAITSGYRKNKVNVFHGPFTVESGAELMAKALATVPHPTAIFAANNFLAIGALKHARDVHVHVPGDVAMVGFDDLPSSMVAFPFLTVCTQPAYEMGRCAAQLLFDVSADPKLESREIVLPVSILERESSGQ